jgi:D-alanyl-D-alanine carboxypeptidase (penicillin-binding protein 5/6)
LGTVLLLALCPILARPVADPVAHAQGRSGDVEPRIEARAAVLIDASTGAVLHARRPFDELPPASLTKMVTALVALERGRLDQRVEPTRAYDVVPVLIGIEPGDSLRLEDALYGLLLNSGNDAGMAIAESVGGGSIPRFVEWMNEFALRLGLSHTRFLNPHGLDEEGHVSSAYDMAVIGRAFMMQSVLARIAGERRRVVDGPPQWLFQTTNPLLGTYLGADGIKTGYEDRAGRCIAATAERDGRRAIAVVLNSNRYALDAGALLDAAFATPSWGPVPAESRAGRRPSPGMLRADLERPTIGAPDSIYRASRIEQALTRAAE